jgi:SAM-dependent methyltransferase
MMATFAKNENKPGEAAAAALTIYVCPKCKGSLAVAAHELRCNACAGAYPVRSDTPDFLGGDWRRSKNFSLRHANWFDWLAPIYETNLWYPVVMRLAGVKGVASLPELLKAVEEMTGTVSGTVLDVACGPGTFGRRIAAHAQAVCGIDISLGMLEQGRAYAQREHATNIQYARACVEALPFAGETFAGALCCGSLHLFEDTGLALGEIARTLQPGARLVGVTFTRTDTRFSRFARRHGARFFEVKQLGELLQEAGFEGYRPRTFGSALIFSAQLNGTRAA